MSLNMKCWKGVNKMTGNTTIRAHVQTFEAEFSTNGNRYHLIFGKQTNGWFLCIPNHQIGVELAHPSDQFWNRESLEHAGVPKHEAKAISCTLKELSTYI